MKTNLLVTGATKVCGVMGDPVEHSVSPAMHNAAFRALGLDYAYLPFHVLREDLAAAIAGVRAFNIRGLNITIPHKVAVLPLLDEIDPMARQIGAVNVLLNERGHLSGYNTDAQGFLRMLAGNGIDPQGKNVAVLGAGGAARAICFALASSGATLRVLNRTAAPAQALAADISRAFGLPIKVLELNPENTALALQEACLLVNTTSVGMSPQADATPVDRELLGPQFTVVDIVYNPHKSRLLKEAEQTGARTINGLEMLIWQGALSFEIWTRSRPPLDVMRKSAKAALQRHCPEPALIRHCEERSDEAIHSAREDCRALRARNDEVRIGRNNDDSKGQDKIYED